MKLSIVRPEAIDGLWPLLAKGFEHACRRANADDLNAGLLWQMARRGEGFLIIAADQKDILQASIWQFETPSEGAQGKASEGFSLRCIMLFGHEMHLWYRPLQQLIEQIAIENGATRLITKGRRGWLRQCKGAYQKRGAYHVNKNASQPTDNDYEVDLTNGRQ